MTTKFTIPPVGSGLIGGGRYQDSTYSDGFRAGIDAVIAALREPDEAMREAAWKAITPVEHQYSRMNIVDYRQAIAQVAARAFAAELERRKP